jgi:acrylyl-CoA reductase (NADPH)
MDSFRALLVSKSNDGQTAAVTGVPVSELMEGEVVVRVSHSSLNYKDALAVTGKAPVVRRWPMIPGIDLAGVVESSDSPDWRPGDAVLATGYGLGETHLGGFGQMARLKADWLVPQPAGLSGAESMAIGTAGLTAMLAVLALERHGVVPERGPVVVTGASGGLGSIAIALLARLGFAVCAVSGKADATDGLKALGATEVLDRAEFAGPARPLAKERWAAGIDTVGSAPLAHVLAATRYGGAVAACGNAAGLDLPGSVAPFILRGVSLLGIDSVYVPQAIRREAWARLARDLDRAALTATTTTIGLEDVPAVAATMAAGGGRGRTVIDLAR